MRLTIQYVAVSFLVLLGLTAVYAFRVQDDALIQMCSMPTVIACAVLYISTKFNFRNI